MAEVGRIHCQPFFTTCLLQRVNITLSTNNMYNRFQAFTITSYHLFMAFSISMVTSTDRAMVMGWGSLKTRQSTPLNSSPSPMQARWWVCKKSTSTQTLVHCENYNMNDKLVHNAFNYGPLAFWDSAWFVNKTHLTHLK